MRIDKLDNPAWFSLTETHSLFVIADNNIKFYHPDYCPFGGFTHTDTEKGIEAYASLTSDFYIVGERPVINDSIKLVKELVCDQMVLDHKIDIELDEQIVPLCDEIQCIDLAELVNLVQPGYFKAKTTKLGDYFGIYKDGKLVAVTGERMKMEGYTEVSAVVTHPEYIGKGYAKQLITHICNKIQQEGKTPYLHVAETNLNAIKLYEKLGFKHRRKMSFWNFKTELHH